MTMNCLATPTQRTGEPEAPARASVSERFRRLKWNEVVWCGLATSLRMSALGSNCGKRRAYSEPARLRDQFTGRKILTDLNQKTKTKNHCLLETKLRLEQGRPRHFWKITICPTKIAISSTIRSTTLRCSKRAGRAFRLVSRSTGTCLADVNGDEVEAYLLEAGACCIDRRRRRCAGQLGLRRASS